MITRSIFILLACGLVSFVAAAESIRIEAEHASIKSTGTQRGRMLNLFQNGEVGDVIIVHGEGTQELTISVLAYGSPAGGGWPIMGIAIDDETVASVTVGSAVAVYPFTVSLSPGLHKVAVLFQNDARIERQDRNLFVDYFEIGPNVAKGDTAEWSRVWHERHAAAEIETLVRARERIEQIRKGDVRLEIVDLDGKPVPNAAVTVELTRHDFLFGCNIFWFDLLPTAEQNAQYKERYRQLFNYATTGFYWRAYEPKRGEPQYDKTDAVVAWCKENGITLKGHPLLWEHEAGIPPWSTGQPAPELREARVREIVGRYKGDIPFWEVVNEPAHNPSLLIDAPYRWARDADPAAHLIVNDAQVLADGYQPFFDLLEAANRNNVPFDGIGIQAHEPTTMRFPLDRVQKRLDKYAALGKALHITEFTPTSGGQPITGSHIQGVWDEAAQADYAVKFYTVCFAHLAMEAISWWDLCDYQAWQPGGGLLREDMSPKPAYDALMNLIHKEWHTHVSGRTDSKGMFTFRGYYGTYDIITGDRIKNRGVAVHERDKSKVLVSVR